jgi:hypothetical protein
VPASFAFFFLAQAGKQRASATQNPACIELAPFGAHYSQEKPPCRKNPSKYVPWPPPSIAPRAPPPSIPGPGTRTSNPKAAVRRCSAAWQRAFDAYMEKNAAKSAASLFAADLADEACRNAMPMLAGYEGIRAPLRLPGRPRHPST